MDLLKLHIRRCLEIIAVAAAAAEQEDRGGRGNSAATLQLSMPTGAAAAVGTEEAGPAVAVDGVGAAAVSGFCCHLLELLPPPLLLPLAERIVLPATSEVGLSSVAAATAGCYSAQCSLLKMK
jgi:hypothetical protein